jgi:hypothetical protein
LMNRVACPVVNGLPDFFCSFTFVNPCLLPLDGENRMPRSDHLTASNQVHMPLIPSKRPARMTKIGQTNVCNALDY